MTAWKRELEVCGPDMRFLILAAFDDGADLVNIEDYPTGLYALTLRFWAVREGEDLINLETFDDWDQPALLGEKTAMIVM